MINYSDCLNLGFKRVETEDIVFFNTYGYKYFFLTFEKGLVSLIWSPINQQVDMYLNMHLYRADILPSEVEDIIELLNKEN